MASSGFPGLADVILKLEIFETVCDVVIVMLGKIQHIQQSKIMHEMT